MNLYKNQRIDFSKNNVLLKYCNGLQKACLCAILAMTMVCCRQSKKDNSILTQTEALADLTQFEQLLALNSSYAQIANDDYKTKIKAIRTAIEVKERIPIIFLARRMADVMSSITDRHASVRNQSKNQPVCGTCRLRLPFVAKRLGDKIVALKPLENSDASVNQYRYLDKNHPFIKSVAGISIPELEWLSLDRKAPKYARLSRIAKMELRYIGAFYDMYKGTPIKKNIKVVLTNGTDDKELQVTLTERRINDDANVDAYMDAIKDDLKAQQYDKAIRVLSGNVGYIALPRMRMYKGLKKRIIKAFDEFKNTKALIIDVRYNPGGQRSLLQLIAPYVIDPKDSPWVANVAYLRSNNKVLSKEETASMEGRYLYPYEHFNASERSAIDEFNRDFAPKVHFDDQLFSKPHYMVLRSGSKFYDKPVYVLVNEFCFSAATVFTTALKGLPNVKIAGVTPDGSSGNSRKFYLKNTNIRVKVSTMVSLQRSGLTLDGNGIVPDIFIDEDEAQVQGKSDTQLNKLLNYINQ